MSFIEDIDKIIVIPETPQQYRKEVLNMDYITQMVADRAKQAGKELPHYKIRQIATRLKSIGDKEPMILFRTLVELADEFIAG